MNSDFIETPDGLRLHHVYWEPQVDSERVIIIVHGISEHVRRYDHVAEHLIQAGYHIYAQDHRGHGESTGERVHVGSNTAYIRDLKSFYDRIKRQHPTAKIYMLGHSMGSIISLQFVLTYPDAIDALTITGTATDVASGVSPLLRTVGNVVHRINKKAPIQAPGGSEVLTRDPDMLKAADEDPLMYKGWTKTSTAKYILETGELLQERAAEITLPILIMHGADDELTPVSGSQIMYERVGSADKTLKIWDNMLHEVLNEVDRADVLAEITAWFNKH